jgi:tetratricopeptide (TPR) repeat protein
VKDKYPLLGFAFASFRDCAIIELGVLWAQQVSERVESLNKAALLVREGFLAEAMLIINGELAAHGDDSEFLLLMNTIYRIQGKFCESLACALRVIRTNPDHYDGYARAAQDALREGQLSLALCVINNGLDRFPSHPWILVTALRVYVCDRNFEEAIDIGFMLRGIDAGFVDLYEPLMLSLLAVGRLADASSLADDALQIFPESLHFTRLKACLLARMGRFDECRWFLYGSLQLLPDIDSKRMLTEEIYHLETRVRQRVSSVKRSLGCDVICIASDEAPYIHEFIHHYIYLGFKHLFVGVNNCSDETVSVVEKIAERYPCVHLINVDNEIACFKQWGAYHRLFDIALNLSDSSHCLFVDVDEFWIADPFPKKIEEFMLQSLPFDVYSFNWLNVYSSGMFSSPLAPGSVYERSDWVKSLFAYDCPVSRIGVHGPVLDFPFHCDPVIKVNGRLNQSVSVSLSGLEVEGRNLESVGSDVCQEGAAFVIHQMNRSEIEYSHRVFKVHANDDRDRVCFKTNRYGWTSPSFFGGKRRDVYFRFSAPGIIDSYARSLKRFESKCCISELVAGARLAISESAVLSKIDAMSDEILMRDLSIARQVFRGTRFLKRVEERVASIC